LQNVTKYSMRGYKIYSTLRQEYFVRARRTTIICGQKHQLTTKNVTRSQ